MKSRHFFYLFLIAIFLTAESPVHLSDKPADKKNSVPTDSSLLSELYAKSVKDDRFIVDTDEPMAAESLNRISGDYDLGRSSSEQSYTMDDQYHAGAFGRKEPKASKNLA